MARSSTTFKKGEKRTKEISALGAKARQENGYKSWREKLYAEAVDEDGRTIHDKLFDLLVDMALKDKDHFAIKELNDRVNGTSRQSIEIDATIETTERVLNFQEMVDEERAKAKKPIKKAKKAPKKKAKK